MEDEESTTAAVSSLSSTTTTKSETLVSEPGLNSVEAAEDGGENPLAGSKPTSLDHKDIFRAIEVVERDSVAIAESFTSLFDSLRLALSEATSSSVDHMQCFSDAAGQIQERALDAASKGNRYINSCLRLNKEMKHVDGLAKQLYPWFLLAFSLHTHLFALSYTGLLP
ncbi:hypothetical protein RHSIM_Rhsim07G0090400 [Rhododendron simsii]|uniref:BLOC-1-related complex subunit 6 C-terminal helix domain-containing protein n=1 Tax=Rhododendron simsii TaxID=118357 RepID=A0A834GSY4_RHOSS|nr:hypothetical protein RHSIM_Rhsim07G0090400 [Rhododendron simsii]